MSTPTPSIGGVTSGISVTKMPTRKASLQQRNTAHLPQRITFDVLSAGISASLVAPLITLIDRGIIENASGRARLGESVRNSCRLLFTRPGTYFFSKPFGLIYLLYSSTYITANVSDTIHSSMRALPSSASTPTTSKFLATSATNMSLSLYKDSAFTKLFGPPQTLSLPARVPLPTYLLFGTRDALTIFASFIAPPLLAPHLPPGWEDKLSMSRTSVAQFVVPAGIQLFSTPLHLLGLDLYNRAGRVGTAGRMSRVARDWAKSTGMRIARIVPAFGIGGVVNTRMRRGLMGSLEGK
ncbi:MAG: hypothetical protein M1814_002962 [Vezdaea aestivalis]|nr:MAG: hypothetical protein M1814_002962 [Vezdaea aestivalis]